LKLLFDEPFIGNEFGEFRGRGEVEHDAQNHKRNNGRDDGHPKDEAARQAENREQHDGEQECCRGANREHACRPEGVVGLGFA
jgi:hypothetical protein